MALITPFLVSPVKNRPMFSAPTIGFNAAVTLLPSSEYITSTENPWKGARTSRAKLCLTINSHLYKYYVMYDLDAAFSALADSTRRAILTRLAKGEATVNELAEPFEMTQPAISQHLKVLEDAGLIVRRVEGTKRPRRLAKAGIEAMDQWLAMLRNALEANYDRLDEVLAGMERTKKGKRKGKKR